MADRQGQQLGNYRLLRLLGRGGFAEVYLGQHVHLNSQAALKVLQLALDEKDVEGFLTEARILASLNHPHIVRVHDFAVEHGTPFLVMEYAANGTLRQRHPQGVPVPSEVIIPYVRQVASALQYAHDQHLIHRDVKPENMLLGSRDEVLLSDFGLAMLAPHTADHSTQVMKASLAGTTPYQSPEQLQGKPQPASDQYSLGVVVYEWLCGKRPFNGSPIEIVMQHISMPPPPLHEQLHGISPLIEETVMRALAKDPQQRFASIQDFATALERVYQYTLLPRSSFASFGGSDVLQNSLKPGPMWKVPSVFTPLVGREKEVADICTLLKHPEVRLLTLLGTGGIGKTRVSLQVAREMQSYFADGVCFVHLAALHEPHLVVPMIAQDLGIQEMGAQSILEPVKVALRDRHFLLLLDNFEQVVIVAPVIEELLAACPHLKVVVTSREVLHLTAEHQFPIPPLALPDLNQLPGEEALSQYASVALFIQRAQAVLPTFQLTQANAHTIAEICVCLDGLPLAIVLAAARVKLFPPQALLARLSQRFQVLTDEAGPQPWRHQTLHNALQWSYDLLNSAEQRLFRRLSVFAGGLTLEAVEAVEKMLNGKETSTLSALNGVASLLDKSLLLQSVHEGQEPILQMLRTVREYGLKLLRESREIEQCQHAHALYYLTFVEEAEPHLKGTQQISWMARLELEQENLRLALAWFIEHGEAEHALFFCAALWRFWHLRGYWSEGRRWLEASLALAQAEGSMIARTKALCAAGELAYYQDDYRVARARLEESVVLCRTIGANRELANALGALGVLIHIQGEQQEAHSMFEESEAIYRSLGSKWELSYFLRKLAFRALQEGSITRAIVLAQEALMLAQELGDKFLIANTFATLAQIASREDDRARSMVYIKKSLTLARELGSKYLIAIALQNLGYYAALQGDLTQAEASVQEGLQFIRELGDKLFITTGLHTQGYISKLRGDISQAAASYQEGLSVAQEIGDEKHVGVHLIGLAEVAIAEGHLKRAARMFGVVETILNPGVELMTVERANYERAVESLKIKLGEKAFTTAWAEGRTMTPQQALTTPEQMPVPRLPANVDLRHVPTYPDGLTLRQVEVLRLLAEGQTVAQIAEQLVVSPRTVSTHITSIYRKIQVRTRGAATRYAIEHGLI